MWKPLFQLCLSPSNRQVRWCCQNAMGQSPFSGVELSWSVDQPWCRVTISSRDSWRVIKCHYGTSHIFCNEFQVTWIFEWFWMIRTCGALCHVKHFGQPSQNCKNPQFRWAHLCLDEWDWCGRSFGVEDTSSNTWPASGQQLGVGLM